MKAILFKLRVSLCLVGLIFLLMSGKAMANIINQVSFHSPFFEDGFVSAKLEGVLQNSCTEIENIQFEQEDIKNDISYLRFYVKVLESGEPCTLKSRHFSQNVFLGELNSGKYVVNVYENEFNTLSMVVNLPEEIDFHWNHWNSYDDFLIDSAIEEKNKKGLLL